MSKSPRRSKLRLPETLSIKARLPAPGRAARRHILALAAYSLLGGCAGSGGLASRKSSPSLWVAVSVQPQGETVWRGVRPGDALRSGDRFSLKAAFKRPGYLYVALAPPDHSLDVLVPGQGAEPIELRPGRFSHAPGPGEQQGWVLDSSTGEEHLFVIASARPLDLRQIKAEISADSPAVVETVREPPPVADSKHRPTERSGPDPAAVVAAAENPNGVAVVHFKFRHD